jgi:hypothetical protein
MESEIYLGFLIDDGTSIDESNVQLTGEFGFDGHGGDDIDIDIDECQE